MLELMEDWKLRAYATVKLYREDANMFVIFVSLKSLTDNTACYDAVVTLLS